MEEAREPSLKEDTEVGARALLQRVPCAFTASSSFSLGRLGLGAPQAQPHWLLNLTGGSHNSPMPSAVVELVSSAAGTGPLLLQTQ